MEILGFNADELKNLPYDKIVEGHVNRILHLGTDISNARMKICKTCPIFSPSNETCNRKLWINPKTDDVSFEPLPGYVQGCGCKLKAKTTISDEKCVAGKW